MKCKFLDTECVYDNWSDICNSCTQITGEEIKRQKIVREQNNGIMEQFDKNKKYTIDELNQLKRYYYDYIYSINELIEKEKLSEIAKEKKFTNKYVHSDDYGYMYVTSQTFEEYSIYGDERMLFQGLYFDANIGDYRDNSYFNFDAHHEWRIPIKLFLDGLKSGNFKEITKEEFIEKINNSSNIFNEIKEWIDYIEKEKIK